MRVAVIGAGPAGLTAAYQLAKAGVEVEVFETSLAVGGLARSISLWGQTVDLGPQRFFSSDARVNRLWLEVVERDYAMVDRKTRIYDRDRLSNEPFSRLGAVEACRCLVSYLQARRAFGRPADFQADYNFEQWAVRHFGRRLFESAFKSYSEKLWGMPCDQLDADIGAQRFKSLSLGEVIKNTLRLGFPQNHKPADRFAYPLAGTGLVYERMADYVRGLGGQVHLGTPVRHVLRERNRIAGLDLAGQGERRFQHVISTLPLEQLTRGIPDVPDVAVQSAEQLPFRNTILVYLRVAAENLFPDQWFEVHSPELLMGRVTNFRNWVPELYGQSPDTILSLEYWCSDSDELWKQSDADLIRRAQAEITSTGLLGGARVTGGHAMRFARCIPVYPCGYQQRLQAVAGYLDCLEGLSVIGHHGAGPDNNQDHSILLGVLAAENLLEHREHKLWGRNADEPSRETTMIDDSGLVPLGT